MHAELSSTVNSYALACLNEWAYWDLCNMARVMPKRENWSFLFTARCHVSATTVDSQTQPSYHLINWLICTAYLQLPSVAAHYLCTIYPTSEMSSGQIHPMSSYHVWDHARVEIEAKSDWWNYMLTTKEVGLLWRAPFRLDRWLCTGFRELDYICFHLWFYLFIQRELSDELIVDKKYRSTFYLPVITQRQHKLYNWNS